MLPGPAGALSWHYRKITGHYRGHTGILSILTSSIRFCHVSDFLRSVMWHYRGRLAVAK